MLSTLTRRFLRKSKFKKAPRGFFESRSGSERDEDQEPRSPATVAFSPSNAYEHRSPQPSFQASISTAAVATRELPEPTLPTRLNIPEGTPRGVALVDRHPSFYDPSALSYRAGDIIIILDKNESGNWRGVVDGRVGHFPFVEVEEVLSAEDISFDCPGTVCAC